MLAPRLEGVVSDLVGLGPDECVPCMRFAAEEDDEGDEKEDEDDNESVSSKESDSEDGARSRLAHSDDTVSPMTSEKRRVDR